MKKYYVFLFGNFEDKSKRSVIISKLDEMSDIVNFKYKDDYKEMFVEISCKLSYEEVENTILTSFDNIVEVYHLSEKNDKLSEKNENVFLDEFLSSGDLETNNQFSNDFISLVETYLNNPQLDYEIETDFDEDDEEDFYYNKTNCKLRLDDILDKINITGVDSLTDEEKKYLKTI
jgi:hypothetical protein